jgi:hypothetical protein
MNSWHGRALVGIHYYFLVHYLFSDGAGGCFLDGCMCDGWYQATYGLLGEHGQKGLKEGGRIK